jgi:hypothetical protein
MVSFHRLHGTTLPANTMASSNPPTLSSQVLTRASPEPHCHFLELPRELRDTIYDYVLTHPHGLTSHTYPYFHPAYKNGDPTLDKANPFSYICHQIHAETHARALRLNYLTFRGIGGKTGLETFQDFHATLNALRRAPEKIHIFDNDNNLEQNWNMTLYRFVHMLKHADFPQLKAFGSRHPTTRILLYLKFRPIDAFQVHAVYQAIRCVLRSAQEPNICPLDDIHYPRFEHMIGLMRLHFTLAQVHYTVPDNIRFVFDLGLDSQGEGFCRLCEGACERVDARCDAELRSVGELYADGC